MKKNKKTISDDTDLQDSQRDKQELRGEETTLDLPEIKDIPGQKSKKEFIATGSVDTTSSSADEEGDDVFDDSEDIITDKKTNVSSIERKLLDDAFDPESTEDEPIDDLALDNRDNEGDPLNEKGLDRNLFGRDLDTELEEEEDEE